MIVPCKTCSTANRVPARRLRDRARCAACKAPLLPLAGPIAVGSEHDFDELVGESTVPVLVDFWAPWCGPCRSVGPELDKVAREKGPQIVVAKLDTDAVPSVAGRVGIRAVPTMVLFRSGAEAARISGAMPASEIVQRLGI